MPQDELENRIKELEDILEDKDDTIQFYKDLYERLKRSKTVTIETGNFERITTRRGKIARQKTTRWEKNPEKVGLCYIGNAEFFAYPFSSFEKVFLRIGRNVVVLDKYAIPKLFDAYNKCSWYLDNAKSIVGGKIESDSSLAQEIKLAHGAGFERFKLEEKLTKKEQLKRLEKSKTPEWYKKMRKDEITKEKGGEK